MGFPVYPSAFIPQNAVAVLVRAIGRPPDLLETDPEGEAVLVHEVLHREEVVGRVHRGQLGAVALAGGFGRRVAVHHALVLCHGSFCHAAIGRFIPFDAGTYPVVSAVHVLVATRRWSASQGAFPVDHRGERNEND